MTETLHEFRMIHMDGKPKPADFEPSYFGYSVGHWDGDTLVVETTGLNGYTQVDEEGRPKSSDMRVVERYQKRAPNILDVTYTLYDPRTYSRPVVRPRPVQMGTGAASQRVHLRGEQQEQAGRDRQAAAGSRAMIRTIRVYLGCIARLVGSPQPSAQNAALTTKEGTLREKEAAAAALAAPGDRRGQTAPANRRLLGARKSRSTRWSP